ncbi:MAG: hypothetical protein HQK89_17595 [Nitrospirae bacterium]|nr:hypothetical protein [Nitrospirota bacterium]
MEYTINPIPTGATIQGKARISERTQEKQEQQKKKKKKKAEESVPQVRHVIDFKV